ncbi:MAG: TrmB family transcriptional regulator, partial [Acidimicrobiales bacterium]
MSADPASVERLMELGFSQYEARAYVGLLGKEPMTGYALSNATGIPQPKVYETLRRLARKGTAVQLEGTPARFVALPPAQVLSHLETAFRRRLADAELDLMREAQGGGARELAVLQAMTDWEAIEARAVQLIDSSTRHLYVSLNCEDADAARDALRRADGRGVA